MKKVTVYSAPACGYCIMAKDFFDENHIEYDDFDVTVDEDKMKELSKLTGGKIGVPVIVIDNEVVFGFDRDRVAQLLGI